MTTASTAGRGRTPWWRETDDHLIGGPGNDCLIGGDGYDSAYRYTYVAPHGNDGNGDIEARYTH